MIKLDENELREVFTFSEHIQDSLRRNRVMVNIPPLFSMHRYKICNFQMRRWRWVKILMNIIFNNLDKLSSLNNFSH